MDEVILKCIYCQTNLLLEWRVKCLKCPDDYSLCLQCFSCGVESGQHRNEHPYRIIDESRLMGFGIYPRWWTTDEEEKLLEAIDLYSIGNWVDVANHMRIKSPEECQDHYQKYYVVGNIGRATFKRLVSTITLKDHTSEEKASTNSSRSADLTIQEQQDLGYMPFRDDFDKEYDDEAEALISGVSWAQDEEAVDKAFKVQQVQVYRYRLGEREKRKRMAKNYGVIQSSITWSTKRTLAGKKRQSRDEKDVREKLKTFAKFQRTSEHESAVMALQREKRLKIRIKELLKFRRNGIKIFAEGSEYESARLRREKKKDIRKKLGSANLWKQSRQMMDEESESESHLNPSRPSVFAASTTAGVSRFKSLPGYNLLSCHEKKLCNSIGMKPTMYITIKTCIIRDHLQRCSNTTLKARFPNHLDKGHRRRILHFLTTSGWI